MNNSTVSTGLEVETAPGEQAAELSIKELLLSMAAESATRHAELQDKLSAVITNHKEDIAKLTKLVASLVTVVNSLEARVAALEQGVTEKVEKPDSSASELLCSVRRLEHANLHGERDRCQLFMFSIAMLALFNK